MKRNKRLTYHLTLYFILATTLPLLVSGFVFGLGFVRFGEQTIQTRQESIVEVGRVYIANYFNNLIDKMNLMAGIVDQNGSEWVKTLETVCRHSRETYLSLAIVDMQGNEIVRLENCLASANSTLKNRRSDEAFFRAARGETYIRNASFNQAGKPISAISLLSESKDGQKVVVIGQVDLGNIWQPLNALNIGDEGYLFVVDQRGNLIGYRDPEMIKKERNLAFMPSVAPMLVGQSGVSAQRYSGLLGEEVIGTSSIVSKFNWGLILEQPTAQVYAARNSLALQLFAILIVFAISATIIALLITRSIVKPIEKLEQVAKAISSGDLNARVEIVSDDEIGALARAFQQMQGELSAIYRDLEQRVSERTRDLSIASDVSRQITRELHLDILLPRLVEKTCESFSLYCVSVFLYDSQTQELLLEAGAGTEGKQMKMDAKSFHIDARPSLVAQTARERASVVINDVSESSDHFTNPLLPDTRAEATFPMVVGDELVGVLDLQSEIADHFQESDVLIFTTLAEQIAIAVRNAQLYRKQSHLAQELARTDLMKSQFLASMSHELRTPLNAIINFVEMVAMGMVGPVNEEQENLLNQSIKSSTHLLALINDVLDISKIHAGKLTLFIERDVDLYQEMKAVVEMIQPMVEKKQLQLMQDIADDLPLISCDKRRTRQVLLNLLSNAVKFTPQGSVTLSAIRENSHILFAVTDTGLGIAPEAQAAIFEPFVQTTDGVKVEEGTGLGLPISRSLVQAHGGDLWVVSKVDKGSVFYFTLPVNDNRNGGKQS
jgi:signal transduction histidine kinase